MSPSRPGDILADAFSGRNGRRKASALEKLGHSTHDQEARAGPRRIGDSERGTSLMARWDDRVYGEVTIDDPRILALIACPTVQRLKGIKQAGPSAIAFPFKTVTRYEHCLGVHILLRKLGAGLREQVAGLLHDISHTAFSHAVDFVFSSDEQDHHEALKPEFLERPDMVEAIEALGFTPADFFDDSIYPLLERPLPWLCADRLDYFLRDSLACSVSSRTSVGRVLECVEAIDGMIVFTDVEPARDTVEKFAVMNRDWWASPTESFIYNEFADALREGFRVGALSDADLLFDDDHVLQRLHQASSPLIEKKLARIQSFDPRELGGFVPKVIPKNRWIDPPVKVGSGYRRLSEIG
jgi:HD superfamily phosphohydrolase